MIQTEDINARLFQVIFDVTDIVWEDIVETTLDHILTSQDGGIRVVELLQAKPTAYSSEDVRKMVESDIDNWTAPIE
tara:strand:- start:706 stop:936 length:231 start_codon:yes stop_codon:yes gene_type:complete